MSGGAASGPVVAETMSRSPWTLAAKIAVDDHRAGVSSVGGTSAPQLSGSEKKSRPGLQRAERARVAAPPEFPQLEPCGALLGAETTRQIMRHVGPRGQRRLGSEAAQQRGVAMRHALRSLVSATLAVAASGPVAAADRPATTVAAWEPARAEPVESDIASEKQLRTGIRAYVTGDFKSAADFSQRGLAGDTHQQPNRECAALSRLSLSQAGNAGPGALRPDTRATAGERSLGCRASRRRGKPHPREPGGRPGTTESVAAPVVPLVPPNRHASRPLR